MKLAARSLLLVCLAALPARAEITRFTHIVVIFQENRTPDNLFQGLCAPPYGTGSSCSTSPTSTQYDIQTNNWLNKHSPTGVTQPGTVPLAGSYDLGHSHTDFVKMCDMSSGRCKMDGAWYISCGPLSCPPNPQFKYVDNSSGILNPYLIAHAGTRALLIDADLRNPTLSVKLGGEGIGLIDVLAGWKTVDEAMLIDTRSGLRFLPAGSKPNMPHTNELLASEAMKKLVTALQDSFDYIVLDLPPLIPIVDARVATNFVDSFICVVQWGSTKIEFVKHALLDAPELYDRLLGVILNKVDMKLVRRFESYRHNYYYEKYRARYSSPDPAASAAARQAKETTE